MGIRANDFMKKTDKDFNKAMLDGIEESETKVNEQYGRLEHLFEQLRCLEIIEYDYVSEKVLDKAIDKIEKEIYDFLENKR